MLLYVMGKLKLRNLEGKKRNIQCSCPFAAFSDLHKGDEDAKPSFGILFGKGVSKAHCFTCKWNGDVEKLVEDMRRVGKVEDSLAIELIRVAAELDQVSVEDMVAEIGEYGQAVDEEPDVLIEEKWWAQYSGKTHPYVLDRGIEATTLRSWGAGWDAYRRRAMFPIRTREGQLVGAVGRTVEVGDKYFNYQNFKKQRYLFGEHLIARGVRELIVVEGVFDALMVWQHLAARLLTQEKGVVALLGTDSSFIQVCKLVEASECVTTWFDNDPSGENGAKLLSLALARKQHPVFRVNYPQDVKEGADPSSLLSAGVNIHEVLSDWVSINLDSGGPDDKFSVSFLDDILDDIFTM